MNRLCLQLQEKQECFSTSGEGSGNIFIRCGTFFAEDSSIEADTIGNKDGGITDIRADTLTLSRSDIFSDTKGTGNGGNIVLRIKESADISDFSRVFADATEEDPETGSAGTVLIEAKNISLKNGAKVSAETYGKSKGGSVTLSADEEIRLSDGSQIFSRTTGEQIENAGDAGTVLIETKNISLSGGSLISSDTNSDGEGGNILISGKDGDFSELVHISDSGSIYAGSGSSGNGGFVEIKADNITLDGGSIDSESFGMGTGKGGDISIYATESLSLKNSGGITASTEGPGNAGEISLEVGSLTLDTNASVSSESTWEGDVAGDAGTISIRTDNGVSLSGNSKITTEAANAGKGQISIEAAGGIIFFYPFYIKTYKYI